MTIPTEPIGSIPRPLRLIEAVAAAGDGADPKLDPLYEEAIRDTVERFEATGSPVITDGEQRKYHNFWTYSRAGLAKHRARWIQDSVRRRSYAPHAPADGRAVSLQALCRRLPGRRHALRARAGQAGGHFAFGFEPHVPGAKRFPVIPREEFIDDLLREHETEIRRCLEKGAHKVQIDFTEGRLAIKIDPSGKLLHSFIDLNNLALSRFSAPRIGSGSACIPVPVATAIRPTARMSTTPSCCPACSSCKAGNFYIALAGEADRVRVLKIIRDYHEAGSADFRRRRRADRPAH